MGIIVIGLFILLVATGVPVAFALAAPALLYILVENVPLSLAVSRVTYALDSFPLLAVPIFVLVGSLMNTSGITTRIFRFADALVSRLPGGLAQVNILASLIFAGTSGAALADVGGLGQVEIKAMKEKGYPVGFSAAVTAASATVGPIFPPSIPLIIYAAVAEVSAVHLLLAGIMPALLTVVMLMAVAAYLAVRRGYPRAGRWPSLGELWKSLLPAVPALIAPGILIGGMLTGMFSPTEAAAVTAAYVVVITALAYKEFSWGRLWQAALESARTTATIMVVVASAALFGWVLAVEQVPQSATKALLMLSSNPAVLLLVANAVLLLAGMFMETISALLLLTPILVPPLVSAGVDPVHLGLVVVYNLMIGLLTPPVGMSLFLVSDIAGVSVTRVVREVVPFYIPLAITLLILTYVPAISLWIPRFL